MRNANRHSFLLVIAAILMAATVPVSADCGMTAHPDSAAHDDTDTDAHCDSGCPDCGLPCCAGTAVIPPAVLALAASAPVATQPLPGGPVLPHVDADPLGHPPRA